MQVFVLQVALVRGGMERPVVIAGWGGELDGVGEACAGLQLLAHLRLQALQAARGDFEQGGVARASDSAGSIRSELTTKVLSHLFRLNNTPTARMPSVDSNHILLPCPTLHLLTTRPNSNPSA